jgi:hypothetical protein
MNVRSQQTHHASVADTSSSHWLRLRTISWLFTTAALIAATGCVGNGAGFAEDTSDTDQVAADEPTHTALRNGVFATPQTIGGFSVDGVGVYLSAVDNTAELTLYVVAPAESATFGRPALYLTTQEGDHWQTEVAEFEHVTVEAGESRVFREDAEGTLMEVFADFGGEEG